MFNNSSYRVVCLMDTRLVKPISYIKAHATEILKTLAQGGPPVAISQHGGVKAVLVGAEEYQRTQETLAFLKLLALSDEDIRQGRIRPATDFFAEIRQKISEQSK